MGSEDIHWSKQKQKGVLGMSMWEETPGHIGEIISLGWNQGGGIVIRILPEEQVEVAEERIVWVSLLRPEAEFKLTDKVRCSFTCWAHQTRSIPSGYKIDCLPFGTTWSLSYLIYS